MTSVSERYSRAISSRHLEHKVEPGDIGTIIAAGAAKETLGTSLMRLRAEFDSISKMPGSRRMTQCLKSAHGVRIKVMGLIVARAPLPIELTHDESVDMAARLLEQWCDPNCPACTGRGTIGGYGAPQVICSACGGRTRRSLMWPMELQSFAESIAAEMERSVDAASRRIQHYLR